MGRILERPAPPADAPLKDRVRWLIDQSHEGNVLTAARQIRIPNATLDRIADGTVKKPRPDALASIATYYGTTIDWLWSGRGDPPDLSKDSVRREAEKWGEAVVRWDALLGPLDLYKHSPEAAEAMSDLPEAIAQSLLAFGIWEYSTPADKIWPIASKRMRDASMLEYEAWGMWLEEWIELAGVDEVRKQIIENLPTITARFSNLPRQYGPPVRKRKAKAGRAAKR